MQSLFLPRRVVPAVLLALMCASSVFAQKKSPFSFRVGPSLSFALSDMAQNNVGLGGIAGAERKLSSLFSAEAEASYNYFTGDKVFYANSKNKAYTIPAMLGIKTFFVPFAYVSPRLGTVYFLLNDMSSPELRLIYGLAGGVDLPRKTNRLNLQMGYNAFRYHGITRGYTTLAAAIIIN